MSSKPCILVVGDFINYHILACMNKIQWIEKLKDLESGFVWDGNKATRFLTKEEMCLAQSFVEKKRWVPSAINLTIMVIQETLCNVRNYHGRSYTRHW